MALSDVQIGFLVERYERERDRFEKMAATVARHLSARLRASALPHVPTFRGKDPESLKGKLTRDRARHNLQSFDRDFAPSILDLAGVRVMLYRPRDTQVVCEIVEELFQVAGDPRCRRDYIDPDRYQARHRVVELRADHVASDPGLKNLSGVCCEIQVVTLGDHIWNELEHNIIYKTPLGKPSDEQEALLKVLRSQLNGVGQTVDVLMEATDKQRAANLAAIESPDDLAHALRQRTGRSFRGDFQRLLDLLAGVLRDVTRGKLDELPIGATDLDAAESRMASAGFEVTPDGVKLIVAALWPLYGADFVDIVSSWPGRKGALSRFVGELDDATRKGRI